ncbi:MAG TPA: NAD(P)/FAD-dependent oxidoreductase [Phycisphaerae bacterium]|jgi:glutathione reductase (NADPH)
MGETFDLIVIGTGSAGSSAASRCRVAGWSVAIVDSRPLGGTCALRGCDPKKVLVGVAELVDWSRRMAGKGLSADGLSVDWPALMAFKRTFTDPVPAQREKGFADAGIAVFHGRARFTARTSLEVGAQTLLGRHVLIAAGAKPQPLRIPGEEHISTSDDFLEIQRLPRRILFIGGGFIAFEFAHVAVRAGAEVTVVHRGPRPLARFDPDLVDQLLQSTRALGVRVHVDSPVTAVEKRGGEFIVRVSHQNTERTLAADLVVHGAGRVPDIDDLDLTRAAVQHDRTGVCVNEYLQSVSNPAVYAAGDVASRPRPPLTPIAAMEGRIVAANLLDGNHHRAEYGVVPTVVFTVPALASVGLGEEAARKQGLKFKVRHEDTSGWYSARRVGSPPAGFKVLIEEESRRILGAHLLGPHAEDVISVFALAIRAGLRADELKEMTWAYPTGASDVAYMV